MLRECLYRWLAAGASLGFNLLNLLLAGNLPPFGSVCVVVRAGDGYLLLERSNGRIGLPGGFVRWRENPQQTAQRECREETGLQVRLLDLVGCFCTPTSSWTRMSTLTLVYSAEIVGGQVRQGIEGKPGWFSLEEAGRILDPHYQPLFAGYAQYYRRQPLPASNG
ncbi:MAG TPA: NUDIX hydrolase [Ktedonobacteraceae bacterium]|jgi:ADP-ribose pyrophosphatase YjhB (NUDIX family)